MGASKYYCHLINVVSNLKFHRDLTKKKKHHSLLGMTLNFIQQIVGVFYLMSHPPYFFVDMPLTIYINATHRHVHKCIYSMFVFIIILVFFKN